MTYSRVAVVTGANKGIGLAIVRQLALQYPKSSLNNGSLLIYLTARSSSRGNDALESLKADPALKQAKALASDGGQTEVKFHELDISQTSSIRSFADYVRKSHPDGIDIVINNAGIAMTGFNANVVKETLACNYYGTLEATQDFLPLLKDGGRLINVASMSGHLRGYSDAVKKRFLSAKSHDDITAIMKEFEKAVQQDDVTEAGSSDRAEFPSSAYCVSKAGIIGMTRAIAAEQKNKGSKSLINSCCPGYVKTDMTRGGGPKTPDEGAQTPVMLALEDLGGKTGLFWQHEKVIEW